MEEWKYIDEYDSLPGTKFVHCDTRDFHILCSDDGTRQIVRSTLCALHKLGDVRDAMFRRDEILGWLKSLEQGSGGKGEWRLLSFDFHGTDYEPAGKNPMGTWIKYIRLVRTGETVTMFGRVEPVYIAYMSCSNEPCLLLKRDWFIAEYINQGDVKNSFIPNIPKTNNPEPKVIHCKTMEDLQNIL